MTQGFGPKIPGFDHFEFGNHKQLKKLINTAFIFFNIAFFIYMITIFYKLTKNIILMNYKKNIKISRLIVVYSYKKNRANL